MGLNKNIEIAMQESYENPALRDTVDWYAENIHQLPADQMRAILADEDFFQKVAAARGNELLRLKPTTEHVALQELAVRRRDLRKQEKANRLITVLLYIAIVLIAGAIVVAVWL